ncbi:60S ribosomal protein L6-2 [Arachis ipaensis]|uniref:60S ribosomal protein L6-2 n=1 Tax=Arachis ipaensis TaxID=130454 RepID=UPI000A2B2315|nr:60S ribosomal protein L6-2 [Arachis ipaensis]
MAPKQRAARKVGRNPELVRGIGKYSRSQILTYLRVRLLIQLILYVSLFYHVFRASITPGTVLILLAGRFKGKRVVFLKQLPSGLLLVSGPFKINGVPLRRVNQSYVIATSTKVDVSACNVEKFDDKYFSKEVQKKKKKGEGEFFESEKEEKKTLPQDKKDDQKTVDSALIKAIESVPDLKFYLGARFSLKQGQKPHELVF